MSQSLLVNAATDVIWIETESQSIEGPMIMIIALHTQFTDLLMYYKKKSADF